MKKFKVYEEKRVKGWTFVYADSIKEAEDKLNNGEDDHFNEEDSDVTKTDWNTLQEA